MILIAAPQRIQVDSPDGGVVDSMAMTKDGIAGDLVGGSPQQETNPEDAAGRDAVRADREAVNDTRLAGSDSDQIGMEATPPMAEMESEGWQPSDAPLVPSEQWTSEGTTATRQYLLVGFLGIAGIVLAILLFFAFLRWYPTPASENLAAASQNDAAVVSSQTSTPTDTTLSDASLPDATQPDEAASVTDAGSSTGAATPSDVDPPLSTDSPAEASVDDIQGQPDSTDASIVETNGSADAQVTPASELPSELPPELTAMDADVTPPGNSAPSANLPKQLQGFAPMLQWELQPQLPDAVTVLSEAPLTAEDLGLDTSDDSVQIQSIDWKTHSQTVIPGLIIGPQSLSQFVNLWTNISGVPTVVDLDRLAAANIDRNQKLSLGMVKSATIASVAEHLGAPLGLQVEPRENRYLELTPASERIQATLPSHVSLTGLVKEGEDRAWFIAALDQLFPRLQGQWQIDGDQLARPEQADGMSWFSMVRLIESWRLAAELPASLANYDASQLVNQFVDPNEMAGLNTPLTHISPQSRPVAQVLPRICAEGGLQAWMDWPNLAEVGLGPQTTAVVVTSSRPLRQALTDYADQFSLVVAIEDPQSLWITSPRAYRNQTRLYVLPSLGRTVEQWQQQLRPLTPAGPDGVGAVTVVATPDAKFMLIRCCRPVVNFRGSPLQ